jgi:FecR protein
LIEVSMTAIVRCPLCAIALVSLLLGIGLASLPALAQQRVGVNSAVNPNAMGIPPGGLPRRLVLGQDVVFNERITTEAEGQTQVLFVDESTLSVGPNANMVIDQFVYDPNTGTGKLAASLTRGVFRFVGGKLSKQDNAVTMRTPTATIGIRGGVMLMRQRSDCAARASGSGAGGCNALEVIFVYGKGVTVIGLNGASQTLTRPGFEVTVSGPGASPSDPAPAPPGAAAAMLAQLDGRAGGNGGAPIVPTEVMVASSGIANAISANFAASIQATSQTQPRATQPQNATTTVQQTVPPTTFQAGSVQGAAATASPVNPSSPVSPVATSPVMTSIATPPPVIPIVTPTPTVLVPTPPVVSVVTPPVVTPPVVTPPVVIPPAPPVPPINIASVAGSYYDTGNQGTTLGFKGPGSPYLGGKVVNGIFSVTAANSFGTVSFPLPVGGTALPASGAGTTSPLGPVTGVTYLSPDKTFFFADLFPVTQPTQREFIYGGQPVGATFYQVVGPRILAFAAIPDGALLSAIPFIRQQTGGLLAGASISPLILATPASSVFSTGTGSTKALQASLAISGTGTGQSSAIVVLVGNVFGSPAVLEGVIHGSYVATAAGQPTRINTYYATSADGNGNSFYGGNAISGFVLSPGAGAPSAAETNTLNQTTTANYQFAQPVVPVAAPAVATAAPTAQNLSGWFGGIMTKEPIGGTGSPTPYVLAGQTTISTYPTDLHITATLTGGDPATPGTSGIPASNGMILKFGSTDGTNARQAYINNNLFAVQESPDTQSTVNGTSVPYSTSFPNTNPNIYLVTQTAAPPPASLLPSGLCSTCAYLQWGYWGGELDTPASGSNAARIDVGHINFWVAGAMPTSAMDISALAGANITGTYNGNLIGSVVNNGAQYLASGGLQATYNFLSQSGTFTVSNYDAAAKVLPPTFMLSGNAPLTGPNKSNYAFKFNTSGIAGSVNGGFYGPMAAETGGNFAFSKTTGSPYITSGIFAAKR